jgi:hypothetical protein
VIIYTHGHKPEGGFDRSKRGESSVAKFVGLLEELTTETLIESMPAFRRTLGAEPLREVTPFEGTIPGEFVKSTPSGGSWKSSMNVDALIWRVSVVDRIEAIVDDVFARFVGESPRRLNHSEAQILENL